MTKTPAQYVQCKPGSGIFFNFLHVDSGEFAGQVPETFSVFKAGIN